MRKRVVVLGGGIAGMTAAQELAERGFDVHVVERRPAAGGKPAPAPAMDPFDPGAAPWARNTVEPRDAVARRVLPGEHGFRFFPGVYRQRVHTMRRTPFA